MTDVSLSARLQEAEAAYHKLMTGSQEVSVTIAGYGATTYAQTDISKLESYIATLKRDIERTDSKPRRGIIRISL